MNPVCHICGRPGAHATTDQCLAALQARLNELKPPIVAPEPEPAPSVEPLPPKPVTPTWVTIDEAVVLVRVCRTTICKWIKAGKLTYRLTPTGRVRILRKSLLRPPSVDGERRPATGRPF